ncbi:tail fiber protein [Pedobacter heparinus]|uniref:tail fiber protein n=1 Tax=Pedobacter heparinus TaxID=984 RepID=UPI00292E0850|nr:tail fiber protein [Pedobacter heparinus]
MKVIALSVLSLFLISSVYAQDESYNTITTTSLDANNPTSIRIIGQNDPVGIVSARNISFDFISAGKAQIQAYRNGSMGTTLQFLTNDDTDPLGGTPSVRMQISKNGNVGIGTTSPGQPLTVPIISNAQGISLGTYSSLLAGQFAFIGITGADGTFNGGNLSSTDNGSAGMAIVHTSGGTGNSAEIAFVTHNNGHDSRERLRIDRFGNIGIGTTTPSDKLAVNGKIRAQEIKVETANWPDYVFAKDYKLPSLQQTENHIKEKGHLPGIPSATEVKANGIDLGEMNAKLLQKIEELTLHLIDMNKKIGLLNSTVGEQRDQINQLKNNKR